MFCLCFRLRINIVSCLTFTSLIDFEFIFIYGISEMKVFQLCLTLWPHGLHSPWNSLGQNTGVGSLSLLQGIFPTQGSNPGLLHCRRILYQLSHKGSPSPSVAAANLLLSCVNILGKKIESRWGLGPEEWELKVERGQRWGGGKCTTLRDLSSSWIILFFLAFIF